MKRFNKSWERKNRPNFSIGIIPFFILVLIAFGFKSITPNNHHPTERMHYLLPEGDQFQKLLQHKPILHLYAGKPKRYGCKYGTAPRLQINDKISNIRDIPLAVHLTNKNWRLEGHPIRAELRADKEMNMGLIMDIKRELQKINWVHFNYIQSAKEI